MIFGREPVVIINLVTAIIGVLVVLGVTLPVGLEVALGAVILAVGSIFARSQVTPVDKS